MCGSGGRASNRPITRAAAGGTPFGWSSDMDFTLPPEYLSAHLLWERPKARPAIGDADLTGIYTAVGSALSQWEMLETAMANIYWRLNGGASAGAAYRAYGLLNNINGRKDAAEAAADVFFLERGGKEGGEKPPLRSALDKLLKNYAGASGRRNDIAHGLAVEYFTPSAWFGCFLVPPPYSSRKRSLTGLTNSGDPLEDTAYAYTAAIIEGFGAMFGDLMLTLNRYDQALQEAYFPLGPPGPPDPE